jgi:hypothetical protein
MGRIVHGPLRGTGLFAAAARVLSDRFHEKTGQSFAVHRFGLARALSKLLL